LKYLRVQGTTKHHYGEDNGDEMKHRSCKIQCEEYSYWVNCKGFSVLSILKLPLCKLLGAPRGMYSYSQVLPSAAKVSVLFRLFVSEVCKHAFSSNMNSTIA